MKFVILEVIVLLLIRHGISIDEPTTKTSWKLNECVQVKCNNPQPATSKI